MANLTVQQVPRRPDVFSDDLTTSIGIRRRGEYSMSMQPIFRKRPIGEDKMPKKFQLELIGTELVDTVDKKICPTDGIEMYEFDKGAELSKYFYDPKALDAVKGVYVTNAVEKQRLEAKQLELYMGRMNDEET
jgi:hypothetical protein